MKYCFEFDTKLCPEGDTQALFKSFQDAMLEVRSMLSDMNPELAARLEQVTCKTEHGGHGPKYIHFDIRLKMPGASAFAKWEFRSSDELPMIPSKPQIVAAFCKQDKSGHAVEDFKKSRLGDAIAWAIENGLKNIEDRYAELKQIADADWVKRFYQPDAA